ncbi:PorT family protein [Solitalea sp. MAHUQ-68]|uniref:PorT family protein n=1 Tax=Solitalea agri TaxID=2953739 RepID=A0A9X2F310_9SPHI|nr:outer membrane beta-barrel protein [Solitalea agri]MCO4293316.1 PorT family protein [Solitalea agri]
MKKHLLIISGILLFSISSNAQKWKFGINASIFQNNLSSGTFKDGGYPPDYKKPIDMSLGVFVEKEVNNWLSFQPALIYKGKWTSFSGFLPTVYDQETNTYVDSYIATDYIFRYIEMPLLGKFTPLNHLHLYIGPSIGYAITKDAKVKMFVDYYDYYMNYIGNEEITVKASTEQKRDYYNSFEIGYQIGAGYEYRKFEVGLGYQSNFTSVFKDKENNYSSKPKFHSPSLNISYRFF